MKTSSTTLFFIALFISAIAFTVAFIMSSPDSSSSLESTQYSIVLNDEDGI